MAISKKYEKFWEYLKGTKKSEIKLTMKEIEKILGFKLVYSAYNYREWWSGKSHQLSNIWLEEGFIRKELILGDFIVLERVKNRGE